MRIKVTLSLEEGLWLPFRAECVKRKEQASTVVESLMQQQLQAWRGKAEKKGGESRKH